MGSKIKFGIIGCGDIVKKKFVKAFDKLTDKIEVVAACDINIENAKYLVSKGYAKEHYTDYDVMLEKADIDAVIVATPHPFHAQPVIQAAKKGKHILVEKPMAVNLEEVNAMIDAAKVNNVKLVVLPFVYSDAFNKCVQLINSGMIGVVTDIEGVSVSGVLPPSSWYVSENAGFGSLADLGIYSMSTVIAIGGPVKEVVAMITVTEPVVTLNSGEQCALKQEDVSKVLLRFESGKVGSVTAGWAQGEGKSRVTVRGRNGVLLINGWENTGLFIDAKSGEEMALQNKRQPIDFIGQKFYNIILKPSFGTPAVEMLVDAINNDSDMTKEWNYNRHVMDVILSAYESSKTGKVVQVTSSF